MAILLAGCGASGPQRDAAGAITGAGATRLLSLRVGDCVGDMNASLDDPDAGFNGNLAIVAVPCSERHDAEVLRISKLDGGDWPGLAPVSGEASRGRLALRNRLARVEAAAAPQQLTLFTFAPTQDRWEFEDQRTIVFLVLYRKQVRGPAPA